MVATKLSEIVGIGWGKFASSTSSSTAHPSDNSSSNIKNTNSDGRATATTATTSPSSPSSYYECAQESLDNIAETACSNIASAYSYVSPFSNNDTDNNLLPLRQTLSEDGISLSSSSTSQQQHRRSRILSSTSILSPSLLKLIHNPYIGVRGGSRQSAQSKVAKPPKYKSMDAVRKLLYVCAVDDNNNNQNNNNSNVVDPAIVLSSMTTTGPEVKVEVDDGLQPPPTIPRSSTTTTSSSTATVPTTNTSSTGHNNNINNISSGDVTTPRRRNTIPPSTTTTTLPPLSIGIGIGIGTTLEEHRHRHIQQSLLLQQEQQQLKDQQQQHQQQQQPSEEEEESQQQQQHQSPSKEPYSSSSSSPEETASQLTEGTLRALRDLALDEAVELHLSLRYWSDRWERPIYSWFIAGPFLAAAGLYYDHTRIGRKVSQIQAVLARRLSSIGELQQHILRSGWQRGVASWGFLGEGGDWAEVAGTDGRMSSNTNTNTNTNTDTNRDDDEKYNTTSPIPSRNRSRHRYRPPLQRELSIGSVGLHLDELHSNISTITNHPRQPRDDESLNIKKNRRDGGGGGGSGVGRRQGSLYYTNLHVRKKDGGQIYKDETALAEWSIDAMALIRSQLYRASNGRIQLPYTENWPQGEGGEYHNDTTTTTTTTATPKHDRSSSFTSVVSIQDSHNHLLRDGLGTTTGSSSYMPSWACIVSTSSTRGSSSSTRSIGQDKIKASFPSDGMLSDDYFDDGRAVTNIETNDNINDEIVEVGHDEGEEHVKISNLPLMMDEVSSLLDIMEDIIDIQRDRRLKHLQKPSWYKQNWYLIAITVPSLVYLMIYNLSSTTTTTTGGNHRRSRPIWEFLRYTSSKILDFTKEHVVRPCYALYDEFMKGPESISDRNARNTATETLKKMIRSWLDETYPDMIVGEKERISNTMDISLIEESKEKSMKSVYNMNSVIRMSFIEAQFIKKEMMNALVALDDMQASTNFNMNLAAITPFVLLLWTTKKISTFIVYTAFKWGKSRKETYRSFVDALTEIERLLIMRNNPPAPPSRRMIDTSSTSTNHNNSHHHNDHYPYSSSHATPGIGDCVLGSDDLGMLMLHIHELRTILWQERRRFSPTALRSISEDLAELSGERGCVCVRQQLLIVERMNRAYSFLKQGYIE